MSKEKVFLESFVEALNGKKVTAKLSLSKTVTPRRSALNLLIKGEVSFWNIGKGAYRMSIDLDDNNDGENDIRFYADNFKDYSIDSKVINETDTYKVVKFTYDVILYGGSKLVLSFTEVHNK